MFSFPDFVKKDAILVRAQGKYVIPEKVELDKLSEMYSYLSTYGYTEKEIEEIAVTGLIPDKFGRKVRLIKYFTRIMGATRAIHNCEMLARNRSNEMEVIISVRPDNILRCSRTKHFSSCFNETGCNRNKPRFHAQHKSVAIMFVKDNSGNYTHRAFLYSALDPNPCLVLGRIYSNENDDTLVQKEFLKILLSLNDRVYAYEWWEESHRHSDLVISDRTQGRWSFYYQYDDVFDADGSARVRKVLISRERL